MQIDQNSTLPCTISSVQVLNAPHTRRGFLEKALSPLLKENKDRTLTLAETLEEVSKCTDRLSQFGRSRSLLKIFIHLEVYVNIH